MRSTEINWSELRAAAIALQNVQEAAKRAAVNLPLVEQRRFIERVNKRSQREQWITKAKALVPAKRNEKPLSNIVQSGSELLATRLLEDNKETKLSLSRSIRKAAKHVDDELDGREVFQGSDKVKHLVGAASQIHGWEQKQETGINLNILSIGGEMAVQIRED